MGGWQFGDYVWQYCEMVLSLFWTFPFTTIWNHLARFNHLEYQLPKEQKKLAKHVLTAKTVARARSVTSGGFRL